MEFSICKICSHNKKCANARESAAMAAEKLFCESYVLVIECVISFRADRCDYMHIFRLHSQCQCSSASCKNQSDTRASGASDAVLCSSSRQEQWLPLKMNVKFILYNANMMGKNVCGFASARIEAIERNEQTRNALIQFESSRISRNGHRTFTYHRPLCLRLFAPPPSLPPVRPAPTVIKAELRGTHAKIAFIYIHFNPINCLFSHFSFPPSLWYRRIRINEF